MVGIIWLLTVAFVVSGTVLALLRLRSGQCTPPPTTDYPGVSILKPLKGSECGLEKNLESFFHIDYPVFELVFSVAEASDPAIVILCKLQRRFPQVRSRLIVGAEAAGFNPKVNNLTRSYALAQYDLLLISDSNVRVSPDYLQKKVAHMTAGVGVVTATVAGLEPKSWGGRLEATYLNTFYSRGMSLAFATRNPCVVGKSMLFRRSVADRFGGIRALANYLAEDYALGEEMRRLGLKVELMNDSIRQYIGSYSFRSFWDRHVRWGRIRKAHAPLAFVMEPLFTPFIASVFAAFFLAPWLHFTEAYFLNLALWAGCDLLLMEKFSGRAYAWSPLAWLAREALSIPLWLAVASGNSVEWRGSRIFLSKDGKIQGKETQWKKDHSSGEPQLARTRLRDTIIIATGGSGRPRAILREG